MSDKCPKCGGNRWLYDGTRCSFTRCPMCELCHIEALNSAHKLERLEDMLERIIDPRAREAATWAMGEIMSLRAVVDKLRKTKDGVPIVPGVDMVWLVRTGVTSTLLGVYEARVSVEDDSLLFPGDQVTVEQVPDCYSTEELAEAAAKEESP